MLVRMCTEESKCRGGNDVSETVSQDYEVVVIPADKSECVVICCGIVNVV
jgi:hypothetical protein